MKTPMIKLVVFSILVISVQIANAQVRFGTPKYMGAGCPTAAKNDFLASTHISTTDNTVTILFDQFVLETPKDSKLICQVIVPMFIDRQYQIQVRHIRTTGFVKNAANAETEIKIKSRFVPDSGSTYQNTKKWTGTTDANFELKDSMVALRQSWTTCGQPDLNLIVDYEISSPKINRLDPNLTTVEQSEFQVQWRYCN